MDLRSELANVGKRFACLGQAVEVSAGRYGLNVKEGRAGVYYWEVRDGGAVVSNGSETPGLYSLYKVSQSHASFVERALQAGYSETEITLFKVN